MVKKYIVADVGGTRLRAACFEGTSEQPTTIKRISTWGDELPHERLINLISSIIPQDGGLAAITVAAPGPLDPYTGIIYDAPNIPGWENLPLRQLIQDQFNVPVAIGNDANLAALGEWRFGAGMGHRNLIYITVSTGIGGGVIVDNQLLLGVHGLAGELGHVTILPDGPPCGCGKRGHLESLSSGPAIARRAEQAILNGARSTLPSKRPLTAKDVADAASEGDQVARDALASGGTYLGIAVANYLHIFNPTIIIFGGGVSKSGEAFFGPMEKALRDHVISNRYLDDLILTTCDLGDDAGLIGGLALAHTLEKPEPCQ